jgi:hypothetical protein
MKKLILLVSVLCVFESQLFAQRKTYCNPINVDYGYTPIPNFSEQGRHRATADPVITVFKGNYYLFSTNQWGYWVSPDMSSWRFIPRKFLKPWHHVYDELCAPAVWVMGDTMMVIGSTYAKNFPIWMSTDPTRDNWKEAIDSFTVGAWDPGFLLDDDQRLYAYFGSSNFYPTYGQEIDRHTLAPIGERVELLHLVDSIHGWERFGEYNDNTFLKPFIEGSWMNKYNGKYYLQYGAPGTEFSGYGDGVYVSDKPLGPFIYQSHNPFSYKPGGFARGAGHGATYQDLSGNWWHVSTIVVNVKNNFERRIGIWPAGFDKEGILYCNTAYGDYPHYLPDGKADHLQSRFTGWMLLNYNKPVRVSSSFGSCAPNHAVDEDIRTWWSAATGNKGEWIESDLGEVSTLNAIQVNYADQDVDTSFLGKIPGLFHQYIISVSNDGKSWTNIVDKSANKTDVPHDYVELKSPIKGRYVRLTNIHMPTGKFAICGLRVFGKGNGKVPTAVKGFVPLRGDTDRRNIWMKWALSDQAQGYTIYCGTSPDKLYTSIMVYGKNDYYFKGAEKDQPYFFRIEAFNENGRGELSRVFRAD